jgi:Fis family transcriptional regulator
LRLGFLIIKDELFMDNKFNPYNDTTVVSLRENVAEIMQHYFASLKGEEPRYVYDFFLDEVEEPLLSVVMKVTRDNQSEAARMLGISRGTLRAKLKKFGML